MWCMDLSATVPHPTIIVCTQALHTMLTPQIYCDIQFILLCVQYVELNFVSDIGSEEGAAMAIPDDTSEEPSIEENQGERETSSNSKTTSMNEWSGERWDTVSYVCS